MEEYLKDRHSTLNRELTQAKLDKLKAPTLGQERAAAMKILTVEARINEVNKAQIQLKNETAK